jgi:hypothetical protein
LLANRFIDKYQNQQVRRKIISFFKGNPGPEPEFIPAWYTEMLLREYREVKSLDPEKALKKYEIDYIVLDKSGGDEQKYEEKLKQYGFIKPIEIHNNFVIYRIN